MRRRMLYNIGINDLPYVIEKNEYEVLPSGRKIKTTWRCPFYGAWKNMLKRVAKKSYQYPTYTEVDCCENWRYASNFKTWMETQDWEGKHLDKDIIVFGNKLYSPETCAFVLPKTNFFLLDCRSRKGVFPVGVCFDKEKQKFVAQCSDPFSKGSKFLGRFDTPEEAHEAWRKKKYELAQIVAAAESDARVVAALKKRYSPEEWYRI